MYLTPSCRVRKIKQNRHLYVINNNNSTNNCNITKPKELPGINKLLTFVPSIRIEVKSLSISPNAKRTNLFRRPISNRGATRTTIKPQDQWPWLRLPASRWLNQPVKQCPPSLLVHSYVTWILIEVYIYWLPWQLCDFISVLIIKRWTDRKTW